MITTERLHLRPWREEDKPVFHALANTPAMMEHFGGPVPQAKHDAIVDRMIDQQARNGHCMWVVEIRETGEMAGVCGLRIGGHPNTPVPEELEIGWRIGEKFWGQGIAREAAQASMAWGWANTDRPRIAAWTVIGNKPSWGLMKRLGMVRREDLDFRHPDYAEGDPFGAMIVYTIDRPA
ncbi:RimJ/RimL family protein N-acetyltransferase [Sphingomonas kyeonggiensis]|uniref:GNAT family N-acetyltransferase n=1 Tax=Sphingomonas kyeonggiensis TaxID=1268553 RepID=UPI0027883A17|nr:GNAT family N-acetyltransferase [Sphingomonas kyeonggiensis]MDQ0251124.1 RimJ/RimL family protein N-acetyltransferase [Sphingomonas kyeonggiensis]